MGVSVLLTLLAALLGYYDRPAGLNNVFYDTIQKLQAQQKPDDIVIVAVDEASLIELGKWPWRRGLHAQAINALTQANVKAIASDVLYTEDDLSRPNEDEALVDAVKRNGKTVLPMFIGELRDEGQPLETLPFSELIAANNNRLGHVHVEIDADGICRSVFLKEGIGTPYWNHLSVVLYELVYGKAPTVLPGLVSATVNNAPMAIARSYLNRIRFSVGPGGFDTVSFVDLIRDRIPSESLNDKIIFLGITAAGLSDSFATPVSQEQLHMQGVELHANIFHALREDTLITPLSPWQNAIGSGLLTFICALCITVLRPRHSSIAAIVAISAVPLLSLLLLQFSSLWMAPAASFVMLCLAYPLWSWRRLGQSMQYLGGELASLEREPGFLNERPQLAQLNSGLRLLTQWLPIKAWRIERVDKPTQSSTEEWQHGGSKSTFLLSDQGQFSNIAIDWQSEADAANRSQDAFLSDLVQPWQTANEEPAVRHQDIVAEYIGRIKNSSAAGRKLRNFIYSCLSNLQDGVVVSSLSGRVILINEQARRLLGVSEEAHLSASFTDLLDRSMRSGSDIWKEALQALFLRGIDSQFEALTKADYSVLVQGKKFELDTSADVVVIFTFTDVSELKELERARAETLNFVSHDLRSPLVSILALIAQAERSDALIPIKQYTERALSYTEGFLQLARAESGDASLFECDMHAILDNACEHVFELAGKKHISLRREHCKQSAWVWGNADLLERMLINLLDNAIKYSHDHDVVQTRLTVEKNKVVLYVIDHGIGIPADDIPILFEQFRRGSSRDSLSQKGAGLGLRFVAVTLQRHNGAVQVNSIPERGSEFKVSLPRLEVRDDFE